MKASMNGVLNLSTLDGWWCEGYQTDGGWAIGAGETYQDPEYHDMIECQAMYDVLENEIIPLFYQRSVDNIPRAWIKRMKNSIRWIAPRFNTNRMVADYTRRFYNPAAARWRFLAAEAMTRVRAFSQWKADMRDAWPEFSIEDVSIDVVYDGAHSRLDSKQPQIKAGAQLRVKALVNLGSVDPGQVSVELYHGPVDTWGNIKEGIAIEMDHDSEANQGGLHGFTSAILCQHTGQHGVTVRVLPKHPDLVHSHELGLILWETTA
jgi:starch phosphorylase